MAGTIKHKKIPYTLYALYGHEVLSLPRDLVLLNIALHVLAHDGYRGDIYKDEKLTESIGKIYDVIKQVPTDAYELPW